MDLNIILAVICGAVAFVGVFTMSGNNSSGLLMYLIGIRKYPIANMSESNSKELFTIIRVHKPIWDDITRGKNGLNVIKEKGRCRIDKMSMRRRFCYT